MPLSDALAQPPLPGPGDHLGRYVLLDRVGAGAMGVVYAAWDPRLGRKVAVKLLHEQEPAEQGAQARLQREAQALARLAHPNVVAIHDLGAADGRVFLAMEFVEGGNLRAWLSGRQRGWREVVTLLAQAGEGLAAAHEARLVHRDLKPDNVVVDLRGRPRITDFGLAHAPHEASEGGPPEGPGSALHLAGSVTGAFTGTPAYMAPEQLRGQRADALSDQFGFCVTLFEALTGARPFQGETVPALLEACARGPDFPEGLRLPAFLQRALRQGLAAEPAARFPSMRALLEALQRGLAQRSWAGSVFAGAMATVSLLALGLWLRPAPALCTGGEVAWDGAWSDALAARVVQGAAALAGKPAAAPQAREADRLLGGVHQRWLSAFTQVCLATRKTGEQSEALLDVRMRCLADRRNEVAALAGQLLAGEPEVLGRAVATVLRLPALERCAEVKSDEGPAGPAPPEVLAALSTDLAQIRVLEELHKYDEAAARLPAALERARGPGLGVQRARLLYLNGTLASALGNVALAVERQHETAAAAEESGDDLTAADAWSSLIRLVGNNLSRAAEGRRYAAYAAAAIRRGGGDDTREALRLRQLGLVASRPEGKLDEALALAREARQRLEHAHGPRYEYQRLLCDELLGGALFELGRFEEALAVHRETWVATERLAGGSYSGYAVALVNIGEDLSLLGRPAEGEPWLRRALALMQEYRQPEGYYHHRLALALRLQGRFAEALSEDGFALEASAREGEAEGYWGSFARLGQGLDLLGLGRAREALAPLTEALRARTAGAPETDLADAREALGRAQWQAGQKAAGRALVEQALATSRSLAERYGGWFLSVQRQREEWLAKHR